jgi:hypothetical protein
MGGLDALITYPVTVVFIFTFPPPPSLSALPRRNAMSCLFCFNVSQTSQRVHVNTHLPRWCWLALHYLSYPPANNPSSPFLPSFLPSFLPLTHPSIHHATTTWYKKQNTGYQIGLSHTKVKHTRTYNYNQSPRVRGRPGRKNKKRRRKKQTAYKTPTV